MFQICPKCSYACDVDDTLSSDVCPGCGLIYSKYIASTAKKEKEALTARRNPKPSEGAGSFVLKILLIGLLVAAGSYLYKIKHPQQQTVHTQFDSPPVIAHTQNSIEKREFEELFAHELSFASLATRGQYTVVEVYLDQCSYCRELEKTFVPFLDKRSDVNLVRVHHPGSMNSNIQASSREELEAKMNSMNARMISYQLCGSPHVEVFGPNGDPIAVDTCKSRAGTTFFWDWITAETGIARKSSPTMFTRM